MCISLLEWYFLKYVTPFHYIAISKRTYNTNHNLCNNVKQRRDYSKMSYFIVRWRQNYFFPWNVHACGSKDILIVMITKPILLDRNIFYQTIVMFANSQSNKYAYYEMVIYLYNCKSYYNTKIHWLRWLDQF